MDRRKAEKSRLDGIKSLKIRPKEAMAILGGTTILLQVPGLSNPEFCQQTALSGSLCGNSPPRMERKQKREAKNRRREKKCRVRDQVRVSEEEDGGGAAVLVLTASGSTRERRLY